MNKCTVAKPAAQFWGKRLRKAKDDLSITQFVELSGGVIPTDEQIDQFEEILANDIQSFVEEYGMLELGCSKDDSPHYLLENAAIKAGFSEKLFPRKSIEMKVTSDSITV